MPAVLSPTIEQAYRDKFQTSGKLAQRAKKIFPNGVTHDGRYLEPFAPYVDRAAGSRKWDVDGNELVDYWVGHGALLLGHSHPAIVDAVQKQVELATHPGASHELEIEWGERVQKLVPSCEVLRFTNSGTEATLMAVRIARIVTGRTKVLKFAGHFHGWHDQLIIASEPPHDTGDYAMPGVTPAVMGDLVIVPPNDLDALARGIDEHQPACVILEGNGARWGVVPMRAEFIRGIREITQKKGIIFIHDEVITGFRVHPGGMQGHSGITPDMTTMAKVLAGGLPGGCLGGRADLMQVLAFNNPLGKKMRHPGTYNGNPLSAAAGIACLDLIADGEPNRRANAVAAQIRAGLNEVFAEKNVPWVAYGDFSAIKILPDYHGPRPTSDDFIPYNNDFQKLDRKFDPKLSHTFRCALLLGGVDWMGWAGSTSSEHNSEDVERTIGAFAQCIDVLRQEGLVK